MHLPMATPERSADSSGETAAALEPQGWRIKPHDRHSINTPVASEFSGELRGQELSRLRIFNFYSGRSCILTSNAIGRKIQWSGAGLQKSADSSVGRGLPWLVGGSSPTINRLQKLRLGLGTCCSRQTTGKKSSAPRRTTHHQKMCPKLFAVTQRGRKNILNFVEEASILVTF